MLVCKDNKLECLRQNLNREGRLDVVRIGLIFVSVVCLCGVIVVSN